MPPEATQVNFQSIEEKIRKGLNGKPPLSMIMNLINPTQPYAYHATMSISSSGGDASATFTTQDMPILIRTINLSVFATVSSKSQKVTSELTARDIISLSIVTSGAKKTDTVMELEAVQRLSENNEFYWLIGAKQTITFTMTHSIMTGANFSFPVIGYLDIAGYHFHPEALPLLQPIIQVV